MTKVYEQTERGWKLVFTAQSFQHACKVAKELAIKNGKVYCVNS